MNNFALRLSGPATLFAALVGFASIYLQANSGCGGSVRRALALSVPFVNPSSINPPCEPPLPVESEPRNYRAEYNYDMDGEDLDEGGYEGMEDEGM